RLAAPDLRIAGVLGGHVVHRLQGRLVLTVGVLLERLGDLLVDRLAAPLELLAAAARARRVKVESHYRPSFVLRGGPFSVQNSMAREGEKEPRLSWRSTSRRPGV